MCDLADNLRLVLGYLTVVVKRCSVKVKASKFFDMVRKTANSTFFLADLVFFLNRETCDQFGVA